MKNRVFHHLLLIFSLFGYTESDMKPARREVALIAAFVLFWIFSFSQNAFMIGISVGPEKRAQVHVLSTLGIFLGAFILPLLWPLAYLQYKTSRTKGSSPTRYGLRLVLTGALFLPNIIVRLLGEQAWQMSSFNSGFMAVANGAISTLMIGCIFTLTGKNRVLWPALAFSAGLFVYHLALGPGRELLLPYLFAISGLTLTFAGVLLMVFLAREASLQRAGVPQRNEELEVRSEEFEDRDNEQSSLIPNSSFHIPHFLYPILASLVLFWTNTFTDQLFLPTLTNTISPGFGVTSVTMITVLPLLGFLAGLRWRRFLSIFIPLCFYLFLLTPPLLFFSNSHPLFVILFTLNVTMIRMITVVFPFVILDLYWPEKPKGYLAWLLAVSIHFINTSAVIPAGPFRTLQLDNAYAVGLLTVAAVAFYFLSRKILPAHFAAQLPAQKPTSAAVEEFSPYMAAPSIDDVFRDYNLSERETDVALLLVREGLSNEEMGKRLFISENTVKFHVYNIYQKFGVNKRVAFLAKVLKMGNEQ